MVYSHPSPGICPLSRGAPTIAYHYALLALIGMPDMVNLESSLFSKQDRNYLVNSITCLVLGQVKVNEKSNEITAIPKLLAVLSLANSVVTIDAMGCQTAITEKIIEKKADYVLAVKNNQELLFENIADEFRFSKEIETDEAIDLGHGRIETRKCSVIKNLQPIENQDKWLSWNTVIKIESTREFKNSDKPKEKAVRYYISSLKLTAKQFQHIIRSHWSIENKLHWTLDVAFSEDQSRKRDENAAQNFSVLLKIALNLLKNEKNAKVGLKGKSLKAG